MRGFIAVVVILRFGLGWAPAAPPLQRAGATPAASPVSTAVLVVPGVRIGAWTLTVGITGLKRMLGAPAPGAPRPMFDQQPALIGYSWSLPAGTLTAWTQYGETIGYLELRGDRRYRTARQIGVGSNGIQVQAVYGTPASRTAIPGASRYIYDALGLAVFTQGTSTGFIVVGIDVFRPGTAKTYWKF